MKHHLLPGAFFFLVSIGPVAFGDGLEEVVLLAIDPAERRAVLRVGDGELQILAPNEPIEGTSATVERVLADRLVVQETTGEQQKRSRIAWIYPRDRATGVPHIRYLERSVNAPATPAQPPRGDS